MYPTLFHAIKDLFGLDIPLFKFINSFGFFVVMGFFFAAWTLSLELRRKTADGLFPQQTIQVKRGKGLSWPSLLINAALGFFLGYKVLDVLLGNADLSDPPSYLTSTEGSLVGGVIGSILFIANVYREYLKEKEFL